MKTLMAVMLIAVIVLPIQAAEQKKQCIPKGKKDVATGQVLCCCNTLSGGQCCSYVTFCGSFVPGCMCSPGKAQEKEPDKS